MAEKNSENTIIRIAVEDAEVQVHPPTPGLALLEPISDGPLGILYRANRALDEGAVAVKVFHTFLSTNPRDPFHVQQLHSQLRRIAELDHPAILPILDYGAVSTLNNNSPDRAYVIMDHIRGWSLHDVLAVENCPFIRNLDEVRLFAISMAEALAHAHGRGILHTDLKPRNLFLSRTTEGILQLQVSDFSIAATIRIGVGLRPGEAASPCVAPEMQTGALPDERSDFYSFGQILKLWFRTVWLC